MTKPLQTGQSEPSPEAVARFEAMLDRECKKLLEVVDGAIKMRTAPAEVQRMRHRARADLVDFAMKAVSAYRGRG
jgi:hypothetical protein